MAARQARESRREPGVSLDSCVMSTDANRRDGMKQRLPRVDGPKESDFQSGLAKLSCAGGRSGEKRRECRRPRLELEDAGIGRRAGDLVQALQDWRGERSCWNRVLGFGLRHEERADCQKV